MSWEARFATLTDHAARHAPAGVDWTLSLTAEDSDFVRLTKGKVRQAGSVSQGVVDVRWVIGRRQASESFTISGSVEEDSARLDSAIAWLARELPSLPEDPLLLLDTTPLVESHSAENKLSSSADAIVAILEMAQTPSSVDLVGFYQSGGMHRAFASSFGHRRWFTNYSCSLDWSLVHDADRAVKRSWGGTSVQTAELQAEMNSARADLERLQLPVRRVEPGTYRVFLAPAAVAELLELLAYGDFGAKSQQTKVSALSRLASGEASFDPRIQVTENLADGLAAPFQSDGFDRPEQIPLIVAGRHTGALIAPRTAIEFGLTHNGADKDEAPVALDLAAGELPSGEALAALGTGIWISNLWYVNHSDRPAARCTGMTRFATFWVENGKIVAPISVMRFDDSLYRLFGDRLEALTTERAFFPSVSTYGFRSTSSIRTPGMLISEMIFTL